MLINQQHDELSRLYAYFDPFADSDNLSVGRFSCKAAVDAEDGLPVGNVSRPSGFLSRQFPVECR